MAYSEKSDFPFYRYNPWHDEDFILPLWEDMPLPAECFFPDDGIPQRDWDQYFDYRIDLILESENALRGLLGILVEFQQKRKLMQFLLFICDHLEITRDRESGTLLEFRFQIDFSDQISVCYASEWCGCVSLMDGRKHTFHHIPAVAIGELRNILAEIWEKIRELPFWETIEETEKTITVRRRISRQNHRFAE